MTELIEDEPWETLHELLDAGNAAAVQALVDALPPEQTPRVLFRLSSDDQQRLFGVLKPDTAAELLDEFPDSLAADLIESLDVARAADIVDELPSDQGADLLGSMDGSDAEAILEEMDPRVAAQVRGLITYPHDVAGGLMEPEYCAYPERIAVRDFLRDLSDRRAEIDQLPSRLLLLDRRGRPTGGVDIRDVLLSTPESPLALLAKDIDTLPVAATLDDLEEYFDEYETLGVPIVDDSGRLVGRVRRRAVQEAIAERAQSDQLKVQGIVSGEELRAMPVVARSRRRLSWLSINVVLNIIAASVIALYQETLEAAIALAVFLPIISDMSGCAGNQAVAVSIRELALGLVRPEEILRVLRKEIGLGAMNGLALGLLLAATALLWKGNPYLGLVVGAALAINTVVAACLGGLLPLVLRRLKVDPALVSGPVLTTVTDMCGFFVVLSTGTLLLPRISG